MRIERTASLGSLLLSSSLLALGACGDDGPTGEGSAGTTVGESADTTAGMVTTVGESVDTTAGAEESTTVENPTTGVDSTSAESSSGEPPPGGAGAFRFNSIELKDPTSGLAGAQCNDNNLVNGLLATPLANDGDGDGFLDMGFALNFPTLDQSDGASGSIGFANAQCTAPDGASCGLLDGTQLYESMYSAMAMGTCLEPDPAVVDAGLAAPAESTTGPCFVTESIDATVVTSTVSIPLTQARIAARFVGDPAGNLVEGTIQGFLSDADAAATNVDVMGLSLPLDSLLCDEHNDGGGWWMHMSFTAVTTDWTG
jgi:hypothetical protein